MNLRALVTCFLAIIAGWLSCAGGAQAQDAAMNGKSLPGLESFDFEISRMMSEWDIPGASLVVSKNGRLLLAKGYGTADLDKKIPMTPDTLFRMGSINKTVTAVAVLRLVEGNKLSLDEQIVPLLAKVGIVPDHVGDARASNTTVKNLLQHTAGMDRDRSGDPFFPPLLRDVSRRQGVAPVTCDAIAKDTLERPLDFSPGERYAYSNTGYCMLGKIIEAVSGEPYKKYVSSIVLQPSIGKEFLSGKSIESLPGETKYHSVGQPNVLAAPGLSAFFGVPEPYGSYSIENMEALGAWVATPTDVLKFFLAIDGVHGERLLSADSLRAMQDAPALASMQGNQDRHYGLGVQVTRTHQGNNWWHGGSQPGVQTLAVRAANGLAWVVAFNSSPKDKARESFFGQFDKALWKAAGAVKVWPEGDLF